jgi:hypothetical protein
MNYGMNRTGNLPADPSGKSMTKRGGGRNDVIPKGYRKGQVQNFTPEMMDLFQSLFGYLGPDSDIARLAGGDQSRFDEIEAPAFRQFNDVLEGISNRFSGGSGRGSLGGRRSSAFQNANTAAASNFAQDLASRRHDLSRQAIQDLMGMSNQLLGQRPYEQFLQPKQQKEPSGWETFGQSALRTAGGAAAGFLTGGPAGAVAGGAAGLYSGSSAGNKGYGNYSDTAQGDASMLRNNYGVR